MGVTLLLFHDPRSFPVLSQFNALKNIFKWLSCPTLNHNAGEIITKHAFLPAGHGAAAEEGVGDRRRATRAHVAAAAAATQPPALLAAVGRQGLRASPLAPAARSEKPHGVSVRGPPKAQRRLVTISYMIVWRRALRARLLSSSATLATCRRPPAAPQRPPTCRRRRPHPPGDAARIFASACPLASHTLYGCYLDCLLGARPAALSKMLSARVQINLGVARTYPLDLKHKI